MMQVQVRHDDNIKGSDNLTAQVTSAIEDVLERFRDQITTVEVHLADENGAKSGGDDIRCTIEVRMEGRPPTAVTHHASQLDVALEAAVEKMARSIEHQLGRIRQNEGSR